MQQNTLSTTLGFGGGEGGGDGVLQDLEIAGRLVDKHLNYDSSFPSLLDMLRVSPQGSATVSGLSESDYPNSGDPRSIRHLSFTRKVPLPSELMHHFQHMQCNCMMGLFPEINRAWLTIDSDIYVWVYEDGRDLAYFDGLHETILSVGLVKPKAGVFKKYIEYLLCLTTTSEIVLLGVSFSQTADEEGNSGMHLLPEPLFSVPTDGSYILTIKGTSDGRIFMGAKDGCLYELVYQAEDGWFSRKCQKVNHSRSTLSYLLPFLAFSEDDPVNQVEVDDSRHILYTLSEKGTITVYDLDADGKNMSRVVAIPHNNIMNAALQVAKTVDKSNFKSVVSLCPISTSESPHIHLVVVTGTGVRLYYTTMPLIGGLPQRPSQLTLLHVRLPPGFAANATVYRPTKVHKALYSHGTGVLCSNESNEADTVWTMSSDQYPYHPTLAESQSTHAVDGFVWALADVTPQLWCSALNPTTPQGTKPPLLVTQHQQSPRQLVLLSATGAHVLTFLRPVDQLRQMLEESGGAESNIVKEFFSAMTPTQACATALIIATDPHRPNAQVAEWATRALFLYGANPPPAPVTFTPQTPAGYNFHPTQVSTPMPGQATNTTVVQDAQFSPLHNALYLYLARILRPVWTSPVAKETLLEGKPVLMSAMTAEELGFLAERVDLLAKFLLTNQGGTTPLQPLNASSAKSEHHMLWRGWVRRASLLALRSLLSQALEVLKLMTVLSTHNFTTITTSLQKEIREQLRTMTFRDLVLTGREVCRSLIMALLDRYHGDNASADAISERLRDICPGLYRIEDAKLAKANEIILAAKANTNKAEKEKGFKEAVALCKQIGHHVNVNGISSQLASGGAYEGVVDLCLSVAAQRDPAGLALHYYKNNEPADDHQGYMAFTSRMECYRVIMDQLNQLVGAGVVPQTSPTVPSRPGPPTPPPSTLPSTDATQYANQMMNLIVGSNDELAHVTLYQWLVDTNRTDRLLAITSPYLETFLTRSNGQSPLHHLLWRYYERNRDYFKAAKTLLLLAEQIGDTPVNVRVEYLSRALMCLSSCEMNTASSYSDFMLHMEEKKEVARVQLMVLDALQGEGASADVIAQVNSSLLTLTTLYEKFAEPWSLWECKLAIVHCAGHSEPQLVQSIWTNLIDRELERSRVEPVETRVDSLSSKIKALARLYSANPNYFPLEHIIKECEVRSVRLRTNTSWVVTALQGCGIQVSRLINIYHKLYRSGDSVWEVERSPYHLLGVLAHLITMLVDNEAAVQPPQKRALREQCLDYVAEYLTDLGASADASAGVISAHLKTCQAKLERFV
ncbi:nuclear pore complex protein Nup155-like [Penaeus japonicus]|uniref:nuclear pore complex protein Nup155-like n=1 Tax=Penaeus japonicus TaxID=27405 RepID=UPI001C70FF0B|nr:nuclear pore complex protein Nup155-like [Penaeus japonicus]